MPPGAIEDIHFVSICAGDQQLTWADAGAGASLGRHVAAQAVTGISPAQRIDVASLDGADQLVRYVPSGLSELRFAYSGTGGLVSMEWGSAPDLRSWTIGYDANGAVAGITDPGGATASILSRDSAQRVTRLQLPSGQTVNYSYDANGNLETLSPPGRPAHALAYSADDILIGYTPPTVAGGGAPLTRTIDLAGQFTSLTRPNGSVVDFAYDADGRLISIKMGSAVHSFEYDSSSGDLSRMSSPDIDTRLTYYPGSRPRAVDWTGAVQGSTKYGYDVKSALASIEVVGAAATLVAYDNDGLVRRAGDLSISRNAATGLVDSTQIGALNDRVTGSVSPPVSDQLPPG